MKSINFQVLFGFESEIEVIQNDWVSAPNTAHTVNMNRQKRLNWSKIWFGEAVRSEPEHRKTY